ncbi:MAG: ABC transporter substrate-binding protein [Bacteroidota bacterium]
MNKILIPFFVFFLIFSCKNDKNNEVIISENNNSNSSIKYAKGFDIEYFKNYTKLIIKTPYPDADIEYEYFLIHHGIEIPKALKNKTIIRTPVKKIVATSTTHIPMIELLNEENTLIGFPQTQYISSKKTVALIKKDKVKELGNVQDINTEILLYLKPELVIGFSLTKGSKMFKNIENTGISVIFNGDWLEETPLGRAEWIKFFGALYDKKEQADSIFSNIDIKYNEAKKIALLAKEKPTILSGVLYKDKWNLPAGDSFTATLFNDANTKYLWNKTQGKGSLILSFESVFDQAKDADFWIGSGIYTTLEDMQNSNPHYTEFKAFKNKNIFTFSKKRGPNGGVVYFELAPVQPHIVLQDLVKATHPELLPDYNPFFLEKLN